jgi:integrase
MAKRDQRLQLRGTTYYVRVAVPVALREAGLIKQHEIKRSLKTSDFAEARRLLPLELVKIDAEIAAARRKLNAAPVKTLSRSEMEHFAVQLFHSREAKRQAAVGDGPDGLSPEEAEADVADWLDQLRAPDDDEARNTIDNAARRLLRDNGVELDTASPIWRDFHGLVRRVYLEEARRTLRELQSDFSSVPGDALFEGVEGRKPLPPKVAPVTLSDLITRFRKEPSQLALSPKSKGKNVARDRLFQAFLGEAKPVADITRQDVATLVDLLARLPANAVKLFPKMTAVEAADAAEAKGIAPMTRLTAKGYLSSLHTLMDFAVSRGVRETNPVKGLSVGTDGLSHKDRRRPFSADQLKKIFAAPLYTGCVDDLYGYARPGMNRPKRGRFWVPLLSLFHGLRLGEACQLHVSDVTELDGVPVILIRSTDDDDEDTEKRVKTEAGERFVPVHPEVVKIGFLNYVDQMRRAGTQRLFPELEAAKATGYLSDVFSKWFARFLEKAGAKRDRTSFHSFRHNFRDGLREADISLERVRALGGWSTGDTDENYGSSLKASTLAADMAKVVLPVDLTHLHVPAPGRDV